MTLPNTIESAGYGITGSIGGLPRTTYYTPDGRVIKAIVQIRSFEKRIDGKVIASGTRDANLDKGWLLAKPTELKLYCRFCDKWHDTKREITACGVEQKKFIDSMAKKEIKEEDDKKSELEKRVAELENLIKELKENKISR